MSRWAPVFKEAHIGKQMKSREGELNEGLKISEGRNVEQKPRGGSFVGSGERARWNAGPFPAVDLPGGSQRLDMCLCT